ncbi:hypothetical protein [Pseudomonas aphyarum]|uniref:Uncharacterized protein n=1 Tax=Pseudomonas aphyarum TaxID=2942629 RepID=A0ABT5PV78_9PSED|nr:hypothetical protein [Pseudomonas aphyarum]MDD0969733.1 hypothetical protein [Pseudomonas aphyarum]MDD1127813.1 hypothetical protein [Pseudomonas aphyarum]
MALQVIYSTSVGTVGQWQDTDKWEYPALIEGYGVLAVTPAQWAAQARFKWVVNKKLTDVDPGLLAPPAQPMTEEEAKALAEQQ